MEFDQEVHVGDWVTCYYSGYWQVVDIKHNFADKQLSDSLAIVKKGFTPNLKFHVSLKFCDIRWCEKISAQDLGKIDNYFHENPDKKRSFDAYDGPLPGIAKGWVVDLPDEDVALYQDKLTALPKYFSLRTFNRFAEKIGLRSHMLQSSKSAKYLLTIVTYPWLVDEANHSPLYFLEKGIYLKPHMKERERKS